MGLIGDITISSEGTNLEDFEKGLYTLGTQENNEELSMLRRVQPLYKTILRGEDSYEDLIKLLKELDAPKEFDKFFNFFIKSLYVDDDFYAIMIIIEQHKDDLNKMSTGKVLECISLEIHNDYIKYIT